METNKISELAKILKENNLTRIEFTEGNMHVILEADGNSNNGNSYNNASENNSKNTITQEFNKEVTTKQEFTKQEITTSNEVAEKKCDFTQESPLVGTVYVASKPDEPPFVTVGQKVKEGDPICIIESMKMFNQISASKDGYIGEIFIENGQVVEFGQALVSINEEA